MKNFTVAPGSQNSSNDTKNNKINDHISVRLVSDYQASYSVNALYFNQNVARGQVGDDEQKNRKNGVVNKGAPGGFAFTICAEQVSILCDCVLARP